MTKEIFGRFSGIFVALPTPYQVSGNGDRIDERAFARHIQWLVAHGVRGVIPCGTTGESVALTRDEQRRLIQVAQEVCADTCLVIPGTGAPTTAQALELTQQAQELGCPGALVITPYYVNATQEGMFQHYKTLHDQTDIPLILYSNPSRTGVELAVETVVRLMALPRIMGLKDCGNLTRPLALSSAWAAARPCEDFSLLSGVDDTFLAFLAQGGHGLISVAAGCAPALYVGLYQAWTAADWPTVERMRAQAFALSQALACAPNPAPIKKACELLGWGGAHMRVPLPLLTDQAQRELCVVLEKLSLINGETGRGYVSA